MPVKFIYCSVRFVLEEESLDNRWLHKRISLVYSVLEVIHFRRVKRKGIKRKVFLAHDVKPLEDAEV